MAFIPYVQFGCLHLGNRDTNMKLAYKYRDFVKDNKEVKAILCGDNFDACIPCHKPQTMWNQDDTPQMQYEKGLDFYNPIRKDILMSCTSNHSDRIWKATSIDLDKNLSRELGFQENYVGVLGLRRIQVGKVSYSILLCHGQSSGIDPWRDAHKALSIYPHADIVLLSHTHQMAWLPIVRLSNRKREIETSFIRTGSVINYPRYAKQALYQPKKKGFTIVYFDDKIKKVKADITGDIP